MKILITGGSGFIGLHTAHALLEAGHDIVITQYRVERDLQALSDYAVGRIVREAVDISSPFAVATAVQKHQVEGIIHLAVPGRGALSASEEYRVNMTGLHNVFESAWLAGTKRIIFASSVTVYGSLERGPFHEDQPLPITSKNEVETFKKAGEILILHLAEKSGVEVICARIGYIFGPLYHSMVNPPSRLVHAAFERKPGHFDAIPAADSHDYCYVKDCGRGLALLQTTPTLAHRIYNVGSGRATSNAELVDAVRKIIPSADLRLGSGPAKTQPDPYMSLEQMTRDTGYEPLYDTDSAIADYIAYLRG
ncbi:MAG TPA: NAD(P)-dependent oxidoreductase [Candidatus Binatia bacterium]|nr:NAD(P)-dependent oxidoreductase [Candidatus Binatia bacterium]